LKLKIWLDYDANIHKRIKFAENMSMASKSLVVMGTTYRRLSHSSNFCIVSRVCIAKQDV